MSYPLRIEKSPHKTFVTTRTRNSELWFANNDLLQTRVLAYFAKNQEKFALPIYALSFQGNHYHLVADFSTTNRRDFMRNVNSMVTRLVQLHAATFPGGSLWGRRYSGEALPRNEDVEFYFFYAALQPVLAGLCEHIEDYPGYNSFYDAINEREREFTVTDWAGYNDRKRYNRHIKLKDYQTKYKLKYSRLPGNEHLTKKEYKAKMLKLFHTYRREIVEARRAQGLKFLGAKALREVVPGSLPRFTKKSTRESKRPLVLTKCLETKRLYLAWYFQVLAAFKIASARYRSGIIDAVFPPGTYKPPVLAPP